MGLLKRLGDKADKAYEAVDDAGMTLLRDRRFERAEQLAASGERNEGVITGIRLRTDEDRTTTTLLRIEWFAPEPRVGAVIYGGELPLVMRLGGTVRISTRGDEVALDGDAMGDAAWAQTDARRRSRKVPEQGIDDKALNWTVQSRLKKWQPETATVTAHERQTFMGMASMNWNITVRRADGTFATIKHDAVPYYACWYVVTGSEIPIAVNPKNPAEAQGNWPLLAEQQAVRGSRWQDAPPPGSIAAHLIDEPATDQAAALVGAIAEATGLPNPADAPAPEVAGDGLEAIEGVTVMRYASIEAALTMGRVPPGEHDAVATRDFGVAEGRWTAIKAAWHQRTMTDWRVGAAFGEAYANAVKQLK